MSALAQGLPAPPQKIKNFASYDFNTITLNEKQKKELRQKIRSIKEQPYQKIIVTGHTDNVGSYEANQRVSLKRAQAVADLLAAEGIDPAKIEVAAGGYDAPLQDNDTEDGRQVNRRADLEIYN